MSDLLKELIQQKRDIEKQIRLLKNDTVVFRSVKIDTERFPTSYPDRHYLAIKRSEFDPYNQHNAKQRYTTLFSGTDRKTVIESIPGIIDDLKGLYLKATGKEIK